MIRELRQRHDLSQAQFAEMLGVRLATVSDWERGVAEPSGASGVALSYLALDLAGELRIQKKRGTANA